MHGKLKRNKPNETLKRSRQAISPVISAVILTSILLVILIIAAFVSGNILEMRIQNTEFEQAKTNMMLLDEIIEEAGLKQGAGSYVQFNLNSGGLSMIQGDNITVYINGENIAEFPTLTFVYRAGGFVSHSNPNPTVLRGKQNLIINGTGESLGYLRIENEGGIAHIKLDYNRIKIINLGKSADGLYNLLEIVFFKFERAESQGSGSGLIRISAQNKDVKISSHSYDTVPTISVNGEQWVPYGLTGQTAVIIIESVIEVSLW